MPGGVVARRVLGRVADIREGEVTMTLLMALNGVVLLMSYSCIKPVREPWIYRAIIDDITGVFVPSPTVVEVESAIENAAQSVEHWSGALGRIFSVPMTRFESADAARGYARRKTSTRKETYGSTTFALATHLTGSSSTASHSNCAQASAPPSLDPQAQGRRPSPIFLLRCIAFRDMMSAEDHSSA